MLKAYVFLRQELHNAYLREEDRRFYRLSQPERWAHARRITDVRAAIQGLESKLLEADRLGHAKRVAGEHIDAIDRRVAAQKANPLTIC